LKNWKKKRVFENIYIHSKCWLDWRGEQELVNDISAYLYRGGGGTYRGRKGYAVNIKLINGINIEYILNRL